MAKNGRNENLEWVETAKNLKRKMGTSHLPPD